MFTMSDATGFNTGGSSNVFKVSASKGGVCNSTDPGKFLLKGGFQILMDL